ncbi:GDP-Man:Man(3)GlcNAc(2)-PP-Dol alpha-1,2-mannosyltransferase [Nakaseomyces bracarensis]|uniref:GDP-Man:Man(3)GlcNAc(2)-PP-Dol alpha-1,2-mannosyltransferase n=1 Tax=Nakaseomyces bracarensis TaxID=273131 RepID=A0ABR4NRK4_9SACH
MLLAALVGILCLLALPVVRTPLYELVGKKFVRYQRRALGRSRYTTKYIGFFHPYCNAGGGGEKVLWRAVAETLSYDRNCFVVVYTGDVDSSREEIIKNVRHRFDYDMDFERVGFVFLHHRDWVDGKTWKHLTLLGQAVGSMLLTAEALVRFVPDIWCDTMGYPFGYPVVKFFTGLPIITYTHYPVISSDMLEKLELEIEKSPSKTGTAKLIYWKLFMRWYRFVGSCVDVATTNSTWTNNHIKSIWTKTQSRVIYPPCSTEKLVAHIGVDSEDYSQRKDQAVIIAQFRPEKRHTLLIDNYAEFLDRLEPGQKHFKLIMVGSTRSADDRKYVESLMTHAYEDLGINKDDLVFKTDCSYEEVKNILKESTFGINTMWNEHFGIAVVEYAAAGLISLVHASAGPLLDIIVPWDSTSKRELPYDQIDENNRTGFFFKDKSDPDFKESKEEFQKYETLSQVFEKVNTLTVEKRKAISQRAKDCALSKFSDKQFDHQWDHALDDLEHKVSRLGSN